MSERTLEKKMIGRPVEELPTPALVADLEALEANLTLLSGYFSGKACKLRPHFKSHKCVTLARRQLACANTVGITCAKVSEAEKLVEGGVKDVLVANQLIGRDKVRRAAALNRRATVRVAVDSAEGVRQLGKAASELEVTVGVLVEVDVGMNRCGVKPGAPSMELARLAARTRGLRFDGFQGYEGHLVTIVDAQERREKVSAALGPLLETRAELEKSGLPVAIVSSGGSGTYDITGNFAGVDELQAGSYALMDSHYKKVRAEFANARYILATVISASAGRAVCDVGLKGMGCEYGDPLVLDHPEAKTLYVAEEHLPLEGISAAVGERLRIVPPHGCTTNNLYSRMWMVRNGIIEDVWPIEGRGCLE
ncbi:MAG: hypothetical protein A3F83_13260 [Candidatus Glassbacteria bacterium RIFCSPLOWO2_12_FULL_58_11]|uniref:D-serine dehydratase-like domain-containing protein n=1 Tax=Candidatus Glassbacteria bacterium RIFCSPLOWO2_12_FULL_58_11 TaxID=1817867 RepID=A0A1F5YR63_9BACT|nr:MAG: hypothetical protein A3F83_13260 [Candidatus Glassbacteria bacterium RIFCSPLOWO2_12_FULL_58_11]